MVIAFCFPFSLFAQQGDLVGTPLNNPGLGGNGTNVSNPTLNPTQFGMSGGLTNILNGAPITNAVLSGPKITGATNATFVDANHFGVVVIGTNNAPGIASGTSIIINSLNTTLYPGYNVGDPVIEIDDTNGDFVDFGLHTFHNGGSTPINGEGYVVTPGSMAFLAGLHWQWGNTTYWPAHSGKGGYHLFNYFQVDPDANLWDSVPLVFSPVYYTNGVPVIAGTASTVFDGLQWNPTFQCRPYINQSNAVFDFYSRFFTGPGDGTLPQTSNQVQHQLVVGANPQEFFGGPMYVTGNVYTTSGWLATTNLVYSLAQAAAPFPFIVCLNNSNYVYNGTVHSNTTSSTCGIQEAINALPQAGNSSHPGGGTIFFGPGTFFTYTNIFTPYLSNQAYNLTFQGQGITASGIAYVGSATQNVMTVGSLATRNALVFNMRDMFMGSAVNGLTNVLYLQGYLTNIDGGGGIAEAEIKHCYIGFWPSMTNNNPFTTSIANNSFTHQNLVGIDIECNGDNLIKIEDCSINYCAVGIMWACDHGKIANNYFTFDGYTPGGGVTSIDWPTNTPEWAGPAILFRQPSNGDPSLHINNNQAWDIRGNLFVNCALDYMALFYVDLAGNIGYGPGKYNYWNSVEVYSTETENGGTLAVTSGNPIYIYDSKVGSSVPAAQLPTLQMTNAVYFSTANMIAAPSNVIQIVDNIGSTNNGPWSFGGPVTASQFFGKVTENNFVFANNITANANAFQHGLLPILSANTNQFLRGDGTWTTPNLAGGVASNGTNVFTGTNTFSNNVVITSNLTVSGTISGSIGASNLTGTIPFSTLPSQVITQNYTGNTFYITNIGESIRGTNAQLLISGTNASFLFTNGPNSVIMSNNQVAISGNIVVNNNINVGGNGFFGSLYTDNANISALVPNEFVATDSGQNLVSTLNGSSLTGVGLLGSSNYFSAANAFATNLFLNATSPFSLYTNAATPNNSVIIRGWIVATNIQDNKQLFIPFYQ